MKRKTLLSTAFAICLFPALVSAAPTGDAGAKGKGERPNPGAMFKKIDTDGDGRLSREEVNAAPAKRLQHNFNEIDTNGDGYLSKEEMRAYHQAMRAKMQERRGSKEGPRGEKIENPGRRIDAQTSMEERKARRAERQQAPKED